MYWPSILLLKLYDESMKTSPEIQDGSRPIRVFFFVGHEQQQRAQPPQGATSAPATPTTSTEPGGQQGVLTNAMFRLGRLLGGSWWFGGLNGLVLSVGLAVV